VGTQVCKALAKRNIPFRAAVHSVSKGDAIKKLGNNIEIVEIDHTKPETLEAGLKGITKVFFLSPPFAPISQHLAVVDAIKKAGTVKHIVKLSAAGTEDGGKFQWGKEHHDQEEYIRKAGIALTSIRPTSFSTNLFHEANNIKTGSFLTSSGNQAKLNWISVKDIGEISAVALVDGEKHYGKNYEVTGPDTLTGNEIAKIFSSVLGKEIAYHPLTIPQTKEKVSHFMPPPVAEAYCEMFTYFANGGYDRHNADLEKVTGSKGQSLKEWIEENKIAFQ